MLTDGSSDEAAQAVAHRKHTQARTESATICYGSRGAIGVLDASETRVPVLCEKAPCTDVQELGVRGGLSGKFLGSPPKLSLLSVSLPHPPLQQSDILSKGPSTPCYVTPVHFLYFFP